MNRAKTAILCALVNPDIRGILVKGTSGVAKTTLARGIAGITSKELVNVPINVTEEQLFGYMDLEYAIKEGTIKMQEGLLHRANNNILYIDDVNLFDQRVIRSVMDSVQTCTVKVEREGLSTIYDCDTSVIATMNVSETYINERLLDCFDISVLIDDVHDKDGREEILKRNLEFFDDREAFAEKYEVEETKLIEKISAAQKLLPSVTISDKLIAMISEISMNLGVEGYRGDLSSINTCLALCALDGRTEVSEEDVKEALVLCLSHRRKKSLVQKKAEIAEKETVNFFGDSHMMRFINDDKKGETDEKAEEIINTVESMEVHGVYEGADTDDVVFDIGETFDTIDLLEEAAKTSYLGGNRAKRAFMQGESRDGKYVRSRMTDKKNPDLAFDATIRAAAPYQVRRHEDSKKGLSVIIDRADLREKVREKRGSCTFMFVVDTSGSLIIRSRMIAVKGAIMSMLADHYVKRDRVGFITFNEKATALLLPPSKSVDCVYSLLDELPVGDKTPLSEALIFTENYMSTYTRKHPEEKCYIVLMTDGKANVSMVEGADPFDEAKQIARRMNIPTADWIVVDTGTKRKETDHAKEIAYLLRAQFYKLDELKTEIPTGPLKL